MEKGIKSVPLIVPRKLQIGLVRHTRTSKKMSRKIGTREQRLIFSDSENRTMKRKKNKTSDVEMYTELPKKAMNEFWKMLKNYGKKAVKQMN